MIFHDFGSRLLGSVAKTKIVLYMLSGIGPSGEREISRSIGLSHVAVGKALKEIEETNLLTKRKIGNVNVWSVNDQSYAYLIGKDVEKLAKTPPLLDLRENIEKHFSFKKIKKAVLFGSISEGREKSNSDIDLFLMVEYHDDSVEIKKNIHVISEFYKERYGNALSPFIMTRKEFERAGDIKKKIERGIIIK